MNEQAIPIDFSEQQIVAGRAESEDGGKETPKKQTNSLALKMVTLASVTGLSPGPRRFSLRREEEDDGSARPVKREAFSAHIARPELTGEDLPDSHPPQSLTPSRFDADMEYEQHHSLGVEAEFAAEELSMSDRPETPDSLEVDELLDAKRPAYEPPGGEFNEQTVEEFPNKHPPRSRTPPPRRDMKKQRKKNRPTPADKNTITTQAPPRGQQVQQRNRGASDVLTSPEIVTNGGVQNEDESDVGERYNGDFRLMQQRLQVADTSLGPSAYRVALDDSIARLDVDHIFDDDDDVSMMLRTTSEADEHEAPPIYCSDRASPNTRNQF